MKKFYKDYECGGKVVKKKKLIKELKGEGSHYIFLIKVDNELAGYVNLVSMTTGDWTGKSMFQNLSYVDVEYILPKFRGKGVITEIRKQLENDKNVDTISLSINHLLKKINYWQAQGYKHFVYHPSGKQNYVSEWALVLVTKKDDLILNEYAKKLTLDDLNSFVTFHSNLTIDLLKNELIEAENFERTSKIKKLLELDKLNYNHQKNLRNTTLTKIKQKEREAA